MDDILTEGAQRFIDTGDQDRYDECESAISQVLQDIRRLAQKLKVCCGIIPSAPLFDLHMAIGSPHEE